MDGADGADLCLKLFWEELKLCLKTRLMRKGKAPLRVLPFALIAHEIAIAVKFRFFSTKKCNNCISAVMASARMDKYDNTPWTVEGQYHFHFTVVAFGKSLFVKALKLGLRDAFSVQWTGQFRAQML